HEIRHDPRLGDGRLCETCHEFTLQNHTPVWPFTKGPTPAQETVTEWRGSTAAAEGTTCIDCHMAEHGHAFPGAHNPPFVRQALQVDVIQQTDGTVSARIAAPGAAHRVPTGDPFRSIDLLLCTDATCAETVERVTLRRVFKITDTTWSLLADRTVPPETTQQAAVRTFELKPSTPAAWWQLYYRYGDARFEAGLPADEVGYVISEGPLTAEETP
ncbi:MAG: hypothetical protein KC912_24725, partial [Proteobacteria bacterium]|nr:hypothetical protein [Pseudomonadota bacterium]